MTKDEKELIFNRLLELEERNPAFAENVRDNAYCEAIADVKRIIDGIKEHSLPSNLDEAAEKIAWYIAPDHPDISWDNCFEKIKKGIKAGAEWMAGHGWHDVTETPSIFGFYLVIHEKGWCVANYMGKGVVCESGWVEVVHHIEIEHPQKWLDLRDLIPKKQ